MKLSKGTPEEIWLDRQYEGKFGHIFVFQLRFKDGTVGEYHSKSNVPGKFIVGEERSYSIEEKESKGVKYNKIAPYDPQATEKRITNNKSNTMYQEDPKKQARIVKLVALEAAIDFALSSKATDKTVLNLAIVKFHEWLNIGNPDKDLSITEQACLKRAVLAAELDFLQLKTIEDVLTKADGFFGYITKE